MREALVEEPSGFYPYFDSVYSGGGFTLGAGYRQFTGDRTHWNLAGLYSLSSYKLIEVSVVSPGHASGRLDLSRQRRMAGRHAGGLPRSRYRQSGRYGRSAFACSRLYAGGDVTLRPQRWCVLTAGGVVRRLHAEGPDREFHLGRRHLHPASRSRCRRRSRRTCTRRPSAAFDWRPAADYARRGGLYQVSRHDYADRDSTSTASTDSMSSSCSTFRSCARTGCSRCMAGWRRRSATTIRSRISCCRRSAAAARCAATAAGASAIVTPC